MGEVKQQGGANRFVRLQMPVVENIRREGHDVLMHTVLHT